jgi:hypothetical protein
MGRAVPRGEVSGKRETQDERYYPLNSRDTVFRVGLVTLRSGAANPWSLPWKIGSQARKTSISLMDTKSVSSNRSQPPEERWLTHVGRSALDDGQNRILLTPTAR